MLRERSWLSLGHDRRQTRRAEAMGWAGALCWGLPRDPSGVKGCTGGTGRGQWGMETAQMRIRAIVQGSAELGSGCLSCRGQRGKGRNGNLRQSWISRLKLKVQTEAQQQSGNTPLHCMRDQCLSATQRLGGICVYACSAN